MAYSYDPGGQAMATYVVKLNSDGTQAWWHSWDDGTFTDDADFPIAHGR